LDVAAVFVGFAGVPQVDLFAFHAGGLLSTAISREDLSVEDHIGQALLLGPSQGFVQVRGLVGEHTDDLIDISVCGGPGDAVVAAQRSDVGFCRNHRKPSTAWRKQVNARLHLRVLRRRRSALSNRDTCRASSRETSSMAP
jgi:hypothetical protein